MSDELSITYTAVQTVIMVVVIVVVMVMVIVLAQSLVTQRTAEPKT